MNAYPEPLESAMEAITMLACPWYRRAGICDIGCHQEPNCAVNRPDGGWSKQLEESMDELREWEESLDR